MRVLDLGVQEFLYLFSVFFFPCMMGVLTRISLVAGMRENGESSRKWFAIDSKSFEISVEGEGYNLKGFITSEGKVMFLRFVLVVQV